MDYLAGQILDFIKAHPEWAAFVIGLVAFGESFAFLSLLFPGTAILITSGALIEAGILDAFLPVVAGIIGAVLGDAISFWLGQKFGPFLLEIWPFRGCPQELESGIVFFERYGISSVFIGLFFGPLRRRHSTRGRYVADGAATLLHRQCLVSDCWGASARFRW